ncbi:hypothetical protein B7494_g1779 [Chlorociboria aeruginascens]|nr:hypothetical protein B7494_g1779 [Chlorociboria aeruginascens]
MSTNAVQVGSSMSSVTNTISGSLVNFDFDSDDDVISMSTQEIPCRDINHSRLRSMLTIKFGSEAYDIHIIHDSYCIRAPRKLSASEIDRCRRD